MLGEDREGAAVLACTETATRTETTRRRRPARGAASPGWWRRLPLSSRPRAAAGPRPWTPNPARSLREAPGLADFSAAGVWGMRAWWFQVAAKQLPVGERGEARGRQPRPEVSAAEVCVGFLAAPPERVGGSGPPAVPRGCRGHTHQGASLGEKVRVRTGARTRRAKAGRDPGGTRGCRRRGPPTAVRGEALGLSERRGWRRLKVEGVTPILVTLARPPGMASRELLRG